MLKWLVDTSAWSRQRQPAIRSQLATVDGELLLAPPALLELLRRPQGAAVAAERSLLGETIGLAPVDPTTFSLAADAMENLALQGPELHRVDVPDLVTAAIAHQQGYGVLHVDSDYEQIAAHSGLEFEQRRLAVDEPAPADHPASRQRELRRELHQHLHQLPPATAEALLERFVMAARAAAAA